MLGAWADELRRLSDLVWEIMLVAAEEGDFRMGEQDVRLVTN